MEQNQNEQIKQYVALKGKENYEQKNVVA